MTQLSIRHETLYTYQRPVAFGPHRLLVRPRDSHALRIVQAGLSFSPPGDTRWLYDPLGNCVCMLTPRGEADRLSVISELIIERYPAPLSPLEFSDPQTAMPIVYPGSDRRVLAPFIDPVTDDHEGALAKWIQGQVARPDEPALDFLLRVNQAISAGFDYRARYEEGVQEPGFTVQSGSGTCRDFAWLMVEAVRMMGYAARFVTGYLYSPASTIRGAGATHAWCEVYLPDTGWTEFDPTNGLAESSDLIPVAVTRTPVEATPISGSIIGDSGGSELSVRVDVGLAGALTNAA